MGPARGAARRDAQRAGAQQGAAVRGGDRAQVGEGRQRPRLLHGRAVLGRTGGR